MNPYRYINLKEKKATNLTTLKDLVKPSNDKKRALLANALFEDEAARLASQENSRAYLLRKEQEDRIPFWLWCTLYFILGMFFRQMILFLNY